MTLLLLCQCSISAKTHPYPWSMNLKTCQRKCPSSSCWCILSQLKYTLREAMSRRTRSSVQLSIKSEVAMEDTCTANAGAAANSIPSTHRQRKIRGMLVCTVIMYLVLGNPMYNVGPMSRAHVISKGTLFEESSKGVNETSRWSLPYRVQVLTRSTDLEPGRVQPHGVDTTSRCKYN